VLISATSDNLGQILGAFVPPGQTAALFGSSGAGKSTIVNALLGTANQPTFPVRQSDSRGRHTTTARTLFQLPQGWLLLDMPGIRTVGIAAEDHTVNAAFADVTTLAAGCRFHNCTHTAEPGCAVLANADPQRLAHYRQLRREADYQMRREDASAARAQKAKWKQIHAALRKRPDKRD
jgi:ribosome biogenesis GTPase